MSDEIMALRLEVAEAKAYAKAVADAHRVFDSTVANHITDAIGRYRGELQEYWRFVDDEVRKCQRLRIAMARERSQLRKLLKKAEGQPLTPTPPLEQ